MQDTVISLIPRVSQRPGVRPRYAVLLSIALAWGAGLTGVAAQEHELPSLDPEKAIHHYVHEVWTMEDGLPSNTIRDIVQTQRDRAPGSQRRLVQERRGGSGSGRSGQGGGNSRQDVRGSLTLLLRRHSHEHGGGPRDPSGIHGVCPFVDAGKPAFSRAALTPTRSVATLLPCVFIHLFSHQDLFCPLLTNPSHRHESGEEPWLT